MYFVYDFIIIIVYTASCNTNLTFIEYFCRFPVQYPAIAMICCLSSVMRVYCDKRTEVRSMRFSHRSKSHHLAW